MSDSKRMTTIHLYLLIMSCHTEEILELLNCYYHSLIRIMELVKFSIICYVIWMDIQQP